METIVSALLVGCALWAIYLRGELKKEREASFAASYMLAEVLIDDGRRDDAQERFGLRFDGDMINHQAHGIGNAEARLEHFQYAARKAVESATDAAVTQLVVPGATFDRAGAIDALAELLLERFKSSYRYPKDL